MHRDHDTQIGGAAVQFPTTICTSLFGRPDCTPEESEARIERLIARYWKPIYRTIRIVWRKSNEDAKDLTQSFLLMVLEENLIARFCPSKGRFRSFLKAALAYFLADEQKAQCRIKRGGGKSLVSIDESESGEFSPVDDGHSPDEVLDREWADSLLEESIEELRSRQADCEREKIFQVFEMIDLSPDPCRRPTYREVAGRLGLTESDVTHYLHAARQRLRNILIGRIREYARDEDEIYDELNRIYGG